MNDYFPDVCIPLLITLFKIIKSAQWNCHTSIPAFSIHMHLVNVKIGHMAKFCRHSGSKGQKQVKNGQKNIKICLFWPDFDLILPLKFGCRQKLVFIPILTLVMFISMENVWPEVWQLNWELFSVLTSV